MKLLRLLLLPFAFVAVGIIRLLARFGILVRFGELWAARVGHLAGNTECYLCERDTGMHQAFDIWICRGAISNRYLVRMWRRVMLVDRTPFSAIVMMVNSMFDGWEKHIAKSVQYDRDIYNLMETMPPHLRFTDDEERIGQQELRALCIPAGKPWVCLVVRDSAYLPDLAHNAYRDCDIKNFTHAAHALAERGYYVVRMGAVVHSPMPVTHPKVIDYATSGKRNEFMDIYLGAKCAFCLTTGTGIDAIPYIFRRPMCFVSFSPVEYLQTFIPQSLAIWKHHIKDGKRMTLEEIWESKCGQFMSSADFRAAGITLEENTPEEITSVAMEMCGVLEGKTMYLNGNRLIPSEMQQIEFWTSFPRSISPYNDKPLHGAIKMRIGREFLKEYL